MNERNEEKRKVERKLRKSKENRVKLREGEKK